MNHHANDLRRSLAKARRRRRSAFTLIEVMISVALVLLLMYGVSQVFKMSGDAVGANQAVSKIIRDHRAASATMAEDFRNCAPDSPLFLISSRIGYAGPAPAGTPNFPTGFRHAQDQRDNGNDDPTFFDNNAHAFITLGGNDRVPRMDRMGFFARSLFRRQSTPNNAAATIATSGEGYIWVGHLAIQPLSGGLQQPENQFAADRVLGRVAILMKDASAVANNEAPFVAQSGSNTADLWPFGYRARPADDYSDLAKITMDQFRQIADPAYQAAPAPGSYTGPVDWFRPMDELAPNQVTRFAGSSAVARPITPLALSRTVPYFIGHCSQFIVEYAGDYLKQDAADTVEPGKVVDAISKQDLKPPYLLETGETDGEIDYIIDTSTDIDPATGKPYFPVRSAAVAQKNWVRRVRWYGLPRDINGDGRITVNDVVPLADVLDYFNIRNSANMPVGATWENAKDLPSPALTQLDTGNTYRPWKFDYALTPNTAAPNFRYTCAWHNDAPAMIRVLVKIDDPTGKLQDGQWYEYIFTR
jgi:prepilin-type N-terminal cleavage/methylation domain-containing protein